MAKKIYRIQGHEDGARLESRILEERVQTAVRQGVRKFEIDAMGQHGIGGRLWISMDEPINMTITGSPGQRIGSKGFPGTFIEVMGPVSDDLGWLNAGAEIIVHGNASMVRATPWRKARSLWAAYRFPLHDYDQDQSSF